MPYGSELYHHQRKGAHWGVKNGPPYPLNAEGKKRFRESVKKGKEAPARAKESANQFRNNETAKTVFAPRNKKKYGVSVSEHVLRKNEELTRSSQRLIRDLPVVRTRKQKEAMEKLNRRQQEELNKLSDQELQRRIRRLQMENQYKSMTTPADVSRGRERALATLQILGDVSTVALSAAGLVATLFLL